MKAFVVYEPIDDSIAAIAAAIGRGLTATDMDTTVAAFDALGPEQIIDADLLVAGSPTHGHGLGTHLTHDDGGGEGPEHEPGLHAWLHNLPEGAGRAVATFDTRDEEAGVLTASAAKGIQHVLEGEGFQVAAPPESFRLTSDGVLDDGEEARAEAWAAELGGLLEIVVES